MSSTPPDHEVHVREHPYPGTGRLWTLGLDHGEHITIVGDDSGTRQLSVVPPDDDEPVVTVEMTTMESTTLAALLSGIRFSVQEEQRAPVNAANLRTITLPAGAFAVGKRLEDLDCPDEDQARVIAVIRDDTTDLIEDDPDRPCQIGDRLVLVGRPGSLRSLVQYLLG